MKKFLMAATLATTTMAATAAHAGSISYDFRGDYQSADYNKNAESVTAPTGGATKNSDFSRMYFKIARLDFKGNMNEDLSYRVRWTFYGNTPAVGTRDNIWNNIQLAYITQKLGSGFSVTLGKLYSDIGGFEGAMSGADLYLTSESYSHKFGNDQLASRSYGTGDGNILYMTGAKVDYTFADQVFSAMILNPAQDETTGSGAFNQTSNAWGLVYKGSFMEKAISLIASYHELPGTNNPQGAPTSYTSDDKSKMYSAGFKWDATPVMASIEYIGQQNDYKPAASSFTDKMDSVVVKAAWTGWEQWTPRLEFTSTTEKVDSASATNKFTGYGAIIEYKPRKDDIYRYHLAYQNIKETPETGSDLTRQEIVLGARLMGDFLK
ncbi:porin [Bdellovibrio svalbardensis]|uniref:OprO/OprP family phosphate-selective porin n=1 Tax=Bdellovibrio svalbardensis TaxID=2972972 RepID=A0ABT6DPL5_9BACT|nr:porin [Bdellovibrio svalbardensis]MDG0817083.1 OprO/OprP family phosphate-selective porin [Bdellovibrio svalbardensis]